MPLLPINRDAASAEFFDGAAAGAFLLVQDVRTGDFHGPQFDRSADPQRYVPTPAAGTGTIVSWAVVHHRPPAAAVARIVVGIVELAEGPWWWTEIADADPDSDLDGAQVEVAFARIGTDADEVQPYFRVVNDRTRP